MESTNGDGVGIYEWNKQNAKDYNTGYKKIVYRKLYCNRTANVIANLQSFIRVPVILLISLF